VGGHEGGQIWVAVAPREGLGITGGLFLLQKRGEGTFRKLSGALRKVN